MRTAAIAFFMLLSAVVDASSCVEASAGSAPLDCSTVSRIVKFARRNHASKQDLELLSPTMALKVADRYTDSLIRSYSWFMVNSEVYELQEGTRQADGHAIAAGLITADCSFFERQAKVVEKAYRRLASGGFYVRFDVMEQTLLSAVVLDDREIARRSAYAADFDEVRSRLIQELARLIARDRGVERGESTRRQAARNALYQLKNLMREIERDLWELPYVRALKAFARTLDPHSAYLYDKELRELIDDSRSSVGLGLILEGAFWGVRIAGLVNGGPAQLDGQLKQGEIVVAVDGLSTLGKSVSEVSDMITGPKGTSVRLEVGRARNGGFVDSRELILRREEIRRGLTLLSSRRALVRGKSVLIVRLAEFYLDAAEDLRLLLWGEQKKAPVDALVLDLRDNPGGLVVEACSLASLFLQEGVVVQTETGAGESERMSVNWGDNSYLGPLVVAVNNGSASASEIVVGALKDYGRAVIAGGPRTNGKGSFQARYYASREVPRGGLVLTEGLYYNPAGHSPQKEGIAADIVVPGPSNPEWYEESSYDDAFEARAHDTPFYGRREKRTNQDQFLKASLPKIKEASRKRIASDVRGVLGEMTEDGQMAEIVNIAADHAIIAGKSCVMKNCNPPRRPRN